MLCYVVLFLSSTAARVAPVAVSSVSVSAPFSVPSLFLRSALVFFVLRDKPFFSFLFRLSFRFGNGALS